MEKVKYRKLQKNDYKQIIKLIDDAWNFDKFIDNKKSKEHMLKGFMRTALSNQNYTQIAEVDGEAVGLLFGRIPKSKGRAKSLKSMPIALYHGIYLFIKGKNERKMLQDFGKMIVAYEKLRKNTGKKFDAEIVLFIVNSKCRGLGIGKELINNYLDYCNKQKVKSLYVMTDTNCNYGFYDHMGFTKEGSQKVTFDLYSGAMEFDVFIYTMDL